MVNIGTKIAPVNIAFSSSRHAALIERKMLQYTRLSMKYHHCTLSEMKTHVFTKSDVRACVLIPCVDQKQHSIAYFSTKSINNMLQSCVDVAHEYLQAYNTGADVENYLFCSLHQCKCASYTFFCLRLFSLTKFFEKRSIFLQSIRSKQSLQASHNVTDSWYSFYFYG